MFIDELGRPRLVLIVGIIGSWALQVPLAFTFSNYLHFRTPLYRLFLGVAAGYAVVCAIFVVFILRADWTEAARDAMERSEKSADTSLLVAHEDGQND